MRQDQRAITVLMADDDPDDRMLARDAFKEARLANNLRFVEDGVELMDYLNQRGKYEGRNAAPRPGLILLDLNMPRKNGHQALQEIRNDPNLSYIPIVVLTTSQSEEDILRTYGLGVNSFITKPVTFEGLVEVVKTLATYWLQIVELAPNNVYV